MEGMLQLSPKDELIKKFGKFYSSDSSKPSGRPGIEGESSDVDAGQHHEQFTENGLLLERSVDDSLRVISYAGPDAEVHIPDNATSIAPYAFDGAQGIHRLRYMAGIEDVGIRAMAVGNLIDVIRIDLPKPVDGHSFFEIRFPNTERGKRQQYVALTSPDALDPANLFANYDTAIANSASLHSTADDEGFSTYDQFKAMIGRLKDPIFMSSANKQIISNAIKNNIASICMELAEHGDDAALDDLVSLDFLNEKNITEVIDHVGKVKDASMTAHLFAIRKLWFDCNDDALDFSI